MSAARALNAHLRYMSALADRGGGRVVSDASFAAFASVHPMPFLFNAAVRTDGSGPAADFLDWAQAFFADQGRTGYTVMALDGRDDDVTSEAHARGMKVSDPEPLQSLAPPLQPASAPAPQGLDLRWAAGEADVEDVVEITRAAHRVYGFPDDVWPTIFGRPETVLADDLHVVIASRDGRPVATGQCHYTDRTAYIGWIAVVPDDGRSGLGTHVTRAVVERGFELGADSAVLMASPMGASVYRRMGFHDVGGVRDLSPSPEAA